MLTDETVARVREAWGAPPVNVSAATEAPGIASGSLDRVGMHVWGESVVLEVVDDRNRPVPPGFPGSAGYPNLVNRAQPLIRYELPDWSCSRKCPIPAACRSKTHCPGGRAERVDILTFAGCGRPATSCRCFPLRSPFSSLLDVREYQIVQRRGGELSVRIVAGPAAGDELRERVAQAVVATLEDAGAVAPPVEVEPVERDQRDGGHAAKLKLVIAER